MSNFSNTYQCYLQGYVGDVNGVVLEGAPTERQFKAIALGVYHRVTSKPPLMSSVAVTAELRHLSGTVSQEGDIPSKPLNGCCTLLRIGEHKGAKIAAVKALREAASLPLWEAKKLADNCTGQPMYEDDVHVGYEGGRPVTVIDGDLAKAKRAAKLLRDAGCIVEVS